VFMEKEFFGGKGGDSGGYPGKGREKKNRSWGNLGGVLGGK
jgi:hypothetical protein